MLGEEKRGALSPCGYKTGEKHKKSVDIES
jgi:hypothetical protein